MKVHKMQIRPITSYKWKESGHKAQYFSGVFCIQNVVCVGTASVPRQHGPIATGCAWQPTISALFSAPLVWSIKLFFMWQALQRTCRCFNVKLESTIPLWDKPPYLDIWPYMWKMWKTTCKIGQPERLQKLSASCRKVTALHWHLFSHPSIR